MSEVETPGPPAEGGDKLVEETGKPGRKVSVYGKTPYARSLMKALGGDPKFLKLTPKKVQFWGMDRPESLLNLLPDEEFKQIVENIPDEVLMLPEHELLSRCPPGSPSRVDRRTKIMFWEEYERAAAQLRPMDLEEGLRDTGIRSWKSYSTQLAQSPEMLTWFVSPPVAYKVHMKEASELALTKLYEILSLPIVDPTTKKLNCGIAAIILQAIKWVDVRNHGMPTQRVAQITAHQQVPDEASQMRVEDVDKKLAEIDKLLSGAKLEDLRPIEEKEVIEVTSEVLSGKE